MTNSELQNFCNWLAEQTDLTVSKTFSALSTTHQQAYYERFAPYRQTMDYPRLDEVTDIVGQETVQIMILAAKSMPEAGDTERGTFVVDLMLALLRYLTIHSADTATLESHIRNHEGALFRPMIAQGYDQAVPILRRAKIF